MTEWALPGLLCPCCGTVTFAAPPPGAHAGSVSYGPVLNAAAVLLTACGNVPPERAAQLIGMLLGTEVSPGWVDKDPAVGAAGAGLLVAVQGGKVSVGGLPKGDVTGARGETADRSHSRTLSEVMGHYL